MKEKTQLRKPRNTIDNGGELDKEFGLMWLARERVVNRQPFWTKFIFELTEIISPRLGREEPWDGEVLLEYDKLKKEQKQK